MSLHEELLTALAATHLALLLGVSSVTDVTTHKIPNALLLPALAVAVLLGSIGYGLDGFLAALYGLLVGLAMLLPLYLAGGTAAGDVKLLGVAGAFLGPTGAFFAGLFTFIVGGVLGVLWIAWRRRDDAMRQMLSGLPGAGGSFDLQHSGARLDATFAYAPAIAAGALLAAWYQEWEFFGV